MLNPTCKLLPRVTDALAAAGRVTAISRAQRVTRTSTHPWRTSARDRALRLLVELSYRLDPFPERREKGKPGESRGRKANGAIARKARVMPAGLPNVTGTGGEMSKRIRLLAALSSAWMLTACAADRATNPDGSVLDASASQDVAAHAAIPNQYIVTFRDDVRDAPGLARHLTDEANGHLGHTYTTALKGFSASLSPQAVNALAKNPNVESIEPDQVVSASEVQTPAQWNLDRIDQRSLPMDGAYNYSSTGTGVSVYIVDTGLRITHQDFGGRASYGWDMIDNDAIADDCKGHGTHAAGLVGGTKYGVAKGVQLIGVRVLDCAGAGTTSSVIAGLDWVAQNRRLPAAANLSFNTGFSATLNQAVANTIAAGVTVTVAAGNAGVDACQSSPASAPGAITVGGTIQQDAQLSSSNFGPCLDLYAPGYQLASDWISHDASNWLITGTSTAAPQAAGAAALYLERNPSASPAEVASALTSSATQGVLAALGAGSPNRLLYVGDGSTQPPPPPPPSGDAAPTARFVATCVRTVCSFDANSSSDDHGITRYDWNWGDGASGSGAITSHTYAKAGRYTVTLKVTDTIGQTAQSSQRVQPKK